MVSFCFGFVASIKAHTVMVFHLVLRGCLARRSSEGSIQWWCVGWRERQVLWAIMRKLQSIIKILTFWSCICFTFASISAGTWGRPPLPFWMTASDAVFLSLMDHNLSTYVKSNILLQNKLMTDKQRVVTLPSLTILFCEISFIITVFFACVKWQ